MIAERAVCQTSKVRSFRRELRQTAERDDLLRARRPRRLLPVAEPAGNVQAGLGDQSLQFVLRCELDLRPGGEVAPGRDDAVVGLVGANAGRRVVGGVFPSFDRDDRGMREWALEAFRPPLAAPGGSGVGK